jgi:ribosomal-protein-alanine N-acetyltransferase
MADPFSSFPCLETPRLLLRELCPHDEQALFRLFSDPELTRYYDLDTFQNPSQARELIERFARRFQAQVGLRWAIAFRHQPDQLIGTCGYNLWVRPVRRAILGYELARPHWRQGIMTEALNALLDFGFAPMELNRVEALTFPENTASCLLLEKLGFRREGVLRQYEYLKGKYQDMAMYALLSKERPRSL